MNRRARRAVARQMRRAETVLTSQERPTTAETHVARPTAVQTDASTVQQLMTSALNCHRAGKFIEAENLYREIIAIDPNHIGGLHNLGLIEYQRGHMKPRYHLSEGRSQRIIRSPIVITVSV